MDLVKVIQASGHAAVTILELQDRLNLSNAAQLEQAAREAHAAGARFLVIDLSKAHSISSAGIRSILVIHKMLSGAGDAQKHLHLVCPAPYVCKVLELAGVLKDVEVYSSLDEALAAF